MPSKAIHHLSRPKTGLMVAVLSGLFLLHAQTNSLTAGQAAAIRAEEERWNANDLGQFSYDRITYQVDSVTKAKKSMLTPQPKPGTIAVGVIEHLVAGKSPQQGFRPTIFWLEPIDRDQWRAGFPAYVSRGDILSTSADAIDVLHGKPVPSNTAGPTLYDIGVILFFSGIPIAALLLVILYFLWSRRPMIVRKVTCVNPSCLQIIIPLQGAPCPNCTSTHTSVVKMTVGGALVAGTQIYSAGYQAVRRYCFNCKTRSSVSTLCPQCGTDLETAMLESATRF